MFSKQSCRCDPPDSNRVCWVGQEVCRPVALADRDGQTVPDEDMIVLSLVCIGQVCTRHRCIFDSGVMLI